MSLPSHNPADRHAVLRLIDANANRAREGLRVVEDYARFVLDSAALCERLKGVRHDLAAALAGVSADAVIQRDTPGDVGTGVSTPSEGARADIEAVVTAAGKRVGEALRAVEEFLKIDHPASARGVEAARYRFYDIERAVALTFRPGELRARIEAVRVYVLVTASLCRLDWLETARRAIDGGAGAVQLREKSLEGGELLERAGRLVEACRAGGAISVINDRPDVALIASADGVHVGQGDLPAAAVRKLVGRRMIVGVSTHELAQAKAALVDGADYIGVGPVFRSKTKPREIDPGLAYVSEVTREVALPAVAIAGIDASNVDKVTAAGARCVAVSSAVCDADDPAAEVRRILAKMQG